MHNFDYLVLISYFQLMAALNLAPSLFAPILEGILKRIKAGMVRIAGQMEGELKDKLPEILENKHNEMFCSMEDVLGEESAAVVLAKREAADKRKQHEAELNVIQESAVGEFGSALKLYLRDYELRSKWNIIKINSSLLMSGLFCVLIMVLIPIAEMWLGNLGDQHRYFLIGVLTVFHIVCQVLYFFKTWVGSTAINLLRYTGWLTLFMVPAFIPVIFDNPVLPYNCNLFKSIVMLSMVAAFGPLLAYFTKLRLLVEAILYILRNRQTELKEEAIAKMKAVLTNGKTITEGQDAERVKETKEQDEQTRSRSAREWAIEWIVKRGMIDEPEKTIDIDPQISSDIET